MAQVRPRSHLRPFGNLPQRRQKALAILVVWEVGFAPTPAVQDVIDRARMLDSQLARQARHPTRRRKTLSILAYF
jgi:hypothetical protein